MMKPTSGKQTITNIRGNIVVTIDGKTYEASIVEAWAAQDPETDEWAAAASTEHGSVWALRGVGPIDAIAKCLAVAVSWSELDH